MNTPQTMTTEQFTKRLATLCLHSGLVDMPKDVTDQHILLKSAVLLIQGPGPFSEKEINERLQLWMTQVCAIKFFDRVTLRRWLVDAGYLTRNNDGTGYQMARPGPRPDLFEASVDQVDILATIQAAREEMERRKQAYSGKGR